MEKKYLGKEIKYTVLNRCGICTAVANYRNGDVRILIEFLDSTGRPCEWWIDEKYAEIIE